MTTADVAPLPADIDAALRDLVRSIEVTLGHRLIGVYLEGSFAWGNPVATSDLDLRIVVRELPDDAAKAAIEVARARTEADLGREVGLHVDLIDELIRVGALRFQRSRWLAGEDIRPSVPMKTIDAFVRDAMINAHDLIVGLRKHHGQTPKVPLTAPRPEAEFRGYDIRKILDRGKLVPSSKRLVSNVTAIATALIAQKARIFVFTKGEVPALYARACRRRVGRACRGGLRRVPDQGRISPAHRGRGPRDAHRALRSNGRVREPAG